MNIAQAQTLSRSRKAVSAKSKPKTSCDQKPLSLLWAAQRGVPTYIVYHEPRFPEPFMYAQKQMPLDMPHKITTLSRSSACAHFLTSSPFFRRTLNKLDRHDPVIPKLNPPRSRQPTPLPRLLHSNVNSPYLGIQQILRELYRGRCCGCGFVQGSLLQRTQETDTWRADADNVVCGDLEGECCGGVDY